MRALQILAIVAVGCLVTLPLLIHGASISSYDGANHAMWYSNFSTQLWAGELYPRWLMEMNSGLGSPSFFYYPPVAFFLTSLLKPMFPGDVSGLCQLGISGSIALILSGIFFWLWLRELVDGWSAVLAAILFMITPYHLIMDVYLRGALAETWAFVWLPLILYFTHKVSKDRKWAVAGLAISYALLIATHLPTTLMFSLIPPGYAVIVADAGQRLKRIVNVASGMTIGVGLSGIFLYPAMTTQSYVFIDRMTVGYFYFKNWFLFSKFDVWPDEKIAFLLLAIDLTLVAVCCFGITRNESSESEARYNPAFWFAVAASSFLIMTELSEPIWLIVAPLQKLQFPYRFNVILSFAATALSGFAISSVRSGTFVKLNSVRVITLFCVFIWLPLAAWASYGYFIPGEASDVEYYKREFATTRDAPEYRPRNSQTMAAFDAGNPNVEERRRMLEDEYESLIQRNRASAENPVKYQIVDGAGLVEISSWKPRQILLHTATSSGMKARILQFYYPGWQASMIDTNELLELRPSVPDGLLDLDVPAGDHKISLRLVQTDAERIGKTISLASVTCLILFVIATGLTRRYWRQA